jgi:hypothetical protein
LGVSGGAIAVLAVALGVDFATQGYAGWFGAIHRKLARAEPNASVIAWTVVGRGFSKVTDIQFVPGSAAAIVLVQTGEARLVAFPAGSAPTKPRLSPALS